MLPENASPAFIQGAIAAQKLKRSGRSISTLRRDIASFNVGSYGRRRVPGDMDSPGVSGYSRNRAEHTSDDYVNTKIGDDDPCGCDNCKKHSLTKSQCGCGG